MIIIIRQINLTGIDKRGGSHTFCRKFEGIKNIIKSYFMSISKILLSHDDDNNMPSPIYITHKYSYFVILKAKS